MNIENNTILQDTTLQDTTLQKWNEYINKLDGTINSMWHFMVYGKFIDKEILDLNKKITQLTNENIILLKRKYECCDDDESEKIPKLVIPVNLLKKEYNKKYPSKTKPKYKFISFEERKIVASDIYKTLNTIDDIIKLKHHPKKFDFFDDSKFTRLYNIIPVLEELSQIIGMNNVKTKIFNSICYFIHGITNKEEMNHVMVMGPPGVGKTTIAKIIGSLYLKLGFLHNNNFIVARRSDLIAKYLGQTAIKTQKVIDSAMGGVLFIDEVYSLGNEDNKDSFAKECIDTINLNMSRTDMPWLLIVGGYKHEIETNFLSYNKGLERRFSVKLEINEYTPSELFDMLLKFIKDDKHIIMKDAIKVEDIAEHIKYFKYFGGDMRKLLQLAKENYSIRQMKDIYVLDNNVIPMLLREDFVKSLKQFIKSDDIDMYFHQCNFYSAFK
jgi:SpoVK/Ycf46/Vps4 family AAA+-type ATPase